MSQLKKPVILKRLNPAGIEEMNGKFEGKKVYLEGIPIPKRRNPLKRYCSVQLRIGTRIWILLVDLGEGYFWGSEGF